MKALHLECSTGLGGDMLLAGLEHLGLDLGILESALHTAGLNVHLACKTAIRHGLAGKILEVTPGQHGSLRRFADIEKVIAALPFSQTVRAKSLAAFDRLARVEAHVHGMNKHEVHFHEVGAADTIVDVVGVFWGLETLGVERVTSSALPWFSGRVDSAHGPLPLPAPAVVQLLKNKPFFSTQYMVELITPTGALLLDQIVTEFGRAPYGVLLGHGVGAGRMDLADQPNVLRCYLMEQACEFMHADAHTTIEEIVVLETNVDHLTGEELGACFEALFQDGALDVMFIPGVMKKNRPGGLLQVLCRPEDLASVRGAVFRHTMTLGVRHKTMQRTVLGRKTCLCETPFGPMPMKKTTLDDQGHYRPEFEALRQLARRTGRSVVQLRYLMQAQDEKE